jgi:hypothetical protein
MAASLIDRLPTGQRSRALQRLSRNANSPGASLRQTNGRGQKALRSGAGMWGIFLIESNTTGALAASIGGVNPPGVTPVTLASTGMTPATTPIATSELDAVTWAAPGAQTITVSAPAGIKGEAVITV